MARAEPAVERAGIAERDTAQMRAHADHHQPGFLALGRTVLVGRRRVTRKVRVAGDRILQLFERNRAGFLDLGFRALTDEDRLAAPLGGDRLAPLDLADIDVDLGESKRRGIGVHLVDERPGQRRRANCADRTSGDVEEIPTAGFGGFVEAHGGCHSLTDRARIAPLVADSTPCGKRRHDAISPRS